ncbi:carbohydrate ABC transporter permease [Jatrophihabitans telluris]|uniref:carbohydrate ABC transporter permease n=1 Tax=Jatrophihabitans telluris TaxID=2038343 RepID=UPI003D32273B
MQAARSQSSPARSRSRTGSWRPASGHVFVSGYVVLLALFGLVPALYSLYLAFTDASGKFSGVKNFTRSAKDYRFIPAVQHVAVYLVLWLVTLTIFVVLLALVVHRLTSRRTKAVLRFVYYVPGALAGASSVLLWLFVLDPAVSPVSKLLRWTGNDNFAQVIVPNHLPAVFTIIAFWTGAGGWIVVLYGALNTIPTELMEAARVDGANAVQTALRIQLPMLRKWIAYMLILSLAAGTQLFVEPQLVSQASFGIVGNDYSVNQLAYQYAFSQNDFNGSAAISIDLLIVALICAGFFVARGRLFETD